MLVPMKWFKKLKVRETPVGSEEEKRKIYARSLRKTRSVFREEFKHNYAI